MLFHGYFFETFPSAQAPPPVRAASFCASTSSWAGVRREKERARNTRRRESTGLPQPQVARIVRSSLQLFATSLEDLCSLS